MIMAIRHARRYERKGRWEGCRPLPILAPGNASRFKRVMSSSSFDHHNSGAKSDEAMTTIRVESEALTEPRLVETLSNK